MPAVAAGTGRPAIVARFGREAVADVEMRVASDGTSTGDAEILDLGLAFEIAARETSWIGTTVEPMVDASEPTRRVEIPQAIPQGLSADGLGLRPLVLGTPVVTLGAGGDVGDEGTLMAALFAPRGEPDVRGARLLGRLGRADRGVRSVPAAFTRRRTGTTSTRPPGSRRSRRPWRCGRSKRPSHPDGLSTTGRAVLARIARGRP